MSEPLVISVREADETGLGLALYWRWGDCNPLGHMIEVIESLGDCNRNTPIEDLIVKVARTIPNSCIDLDVLCYFDGKDFKGEELSKVIKLVQDYNLPLKTDGTECLIYITKTSIKQASSNCVGYICADKDLNFKLCSSCVEEEDLEGCYDEEDYEEIMEEIKDIPSFFYKPITKELLPKIKGFYINPIEWMIDRDNKDTIYHYYGN